MSASPPPDVALHLAQPGDRACIDMLMQFYHYDAGEWIALDVESDGRYQFRPVDRFWTASGQAPGQYPFLIRLDGAIAGFAVVDKELVDPANDFNMGYLFILRCYRGRGIGRAAAHDLFTRFRGRWEVYQVEQNQDAVDFWRSVIRRFTGGDFVERRCVIDDRACLQQLFRS